MTINTITTTAAPFAMPAAVVVIAAALALVAFSGRVAVRTAAVTVVSASWRGNLRHAQVVIADHAMADSSLDNRGRGYVVEMKSAKPAALPRGNNT